MNRKNGTQSITSKVVGWGREEKLVIRDGKSIGAVLQEVLIERCRQEELKVAGKFPWTCNDLIHPDTNKPILLAEKLAVLAEEFGEAAEVVCKLMAGKGESKGLSAEDLRTELIQIAAVAVAWAESL
jgi:hypothetical protein